MAYFLLVERRERNEIDFPGADCEVVRGIIIAPDVETARKHRCVQPEDIVRPVALLE